MGSEERFELQAKEKAGRKERSAYFDLCYRKNKFEATLDITTVWFSICIVIYCIVWLAMPLIGFLNLAVGFGPYTF